MNDCTKMLVPAGLDCQDAISIPDQIRRQEERIDDNHRRLTLQIERLQAQCEAINRQLIAWTTPAQLLITDPAAMAAALRAFGIDPATVQSPPEAPLRAPASVAAPAPMR